MSFGTRNDEYWMNPAQNLVCVFQEFLILIPDHDLQTSNNDLASNPGFDNNLSQTLTDWVRV